MALTQEDLQAIGTLLEPINKKLDTVATKQDVKEIVAGNNSILATLFKVELASTAKEVIKVVKAGFQEVVNHIRPLDKTIEEYGKRIEHVEERIGLAKQN